VQTVADVRPHTWEDSSPTLALSPATEEDGSANSSSAEFTNKTDKFLAHDTIFPTRKLAFSRCLRGTSDVAHPDDDVLARGPVMYH